MRLSNGSTTLEVRRFLEKADLLRHLQAGGAFRLFESPEQEQEFYSIVIQPSFISTNVGKTAIGICSEGHGIPPELLPIPEVNLLLIGFDEKVVALDSESGQAVFEYRLRSLFWSFARVPSSETILVFYEIGVKALGKDGRELWDYSKDLLKSATIEGDVLALSFSDSPSVALELVTGQVVNR
jgi:hypothetical protein